MQNIKFDEAIVFCELSQCYLCINYNGIDARFSLMRDDVIFRDLIDLLGVFRSKTFIASDRKPIRLKTLNYTKTPVPREFVWLELFLYKRRKRGSQQNGCDYFGVRFYKYDLTY